MCSEASACNILGNEKAVLTAAIRPRVPGLKKPLKAFVLERNKKANEHAKKVLTQRLNGGKMLRCSTCLSKYGPNPSNRLEQIMRAGGGGATHVFVKNSKEK